MNLSTYKSSILLRDLQDVSLTLIQSDFDLNFWLDFVSFPAEYRESITGMVVKVCEGDLEAMWLTESKGYFWIYSYYNPLPFFRPEDWDTKNLPAYWLEDNSEYNK